MDLWRSQPTAYYSLRSRFARRLCMTLMHGRWANATGLLYAFFSLFGYVTFCHISRIGELLVSRWDAFLLTIAESHPRDDRNLSTEADRYAKTAEGKIRDRRYYFAFDVASRKSRIGGIYCYTLPIYRRVTLGGVSMREVNTGQTISCYALANIDGWLRDALGNNGILTIF